MNRSACMAAIANGRVFDCEIVDERPGITVLEVFGKSAQRAFAGESGGHRWQRVPPNEKRGRRHTSTVTVAVMPVFDPVTTGLDDREIEWYATRGSGKGGQSKNKTSNAVHMKHVPSGTSVRVETTRSQWENREIARRLLAARITQSAIRLMAEDDAKLRKDKIGSGQRGDKIRTIRLQDNRVTNHLTGVSMPADRYLKGDVRSLVSETP